MSTKDAAIEAIRAMPDNVDPDDLIDELEAKFAPQEDPAFLAELERRAEAIRNGTAKGRPGDVVMRELRDRFP